MLNRTALKLAEESMVFKKNKYLFKLFNGITGEESFNKKKDINNSIDPNFYTTKNLLSDLSPNITQKYNYYDTLNQLMLSGSIVTMFSGLCIKFTDVRMKQKLLNTGNAFLVEHNPHINRDIVWSNNNNGTGSNLLGLLLMIIRICIKSKIDENDDALFKKLISILKNVTANSRPNKSTEVHLYKNTFEKPTNEWIKSVANISIILNEYVKQYRPVRHRPVRQSRSAEHRSVRQSRFALRSASPELKNDPDVIAAAK
jgi:hypothetical protein